MSEQKAEYTAGGADPITWKPVEVKLSELEHWKQNPKRLTKSEAARLTASRRKLGRLETIAIGPRQADGKYPLYDGHQRANVWSGGGRVDCQVWALQSDRELTEDERKDVAVLTMTARGSFDWDILSGWDASPDWGFDTDTLNGWKADVAALGNLIESAKADAGDGPEAEIDRAEELREKWGTARGQLWKIGEHRLLCGDSTVRADVERVMGGEKANMAWFDPPFGIALIPQRGLTDTIANDGNGEARDLWEKFLPILSDYLTDPAHVFLCQGWTEFDWTIPLIKRNFRLKSKIVWKKNVWGIGYFTRPQHEDIIYCWKGEHKKIGDPVSDVWEVARESAPDHAAEKPPELSSIAIIHFSSEGDIVADWFCGVGGSLVACQNLQRKCMAIEIDPGYCAVILERMAAMGLEPELIGD